MIADRQKEILQYILEKGEVKLNEICALHPQVSSMTIRRDLDQLEKEGQILRVRGGAKPMASHAALKEAAYTQREVERANSKRIIAEKAAGFIRDARSLYIDSGTTCIRLAEQIPDQNIFVLTPAPYVAMALIKNFNVRVNLSGGSLNRDTLALSGGNALSYIKSLNIDLAFIGASACSLNNGFSCGDYQEAELKKLIIKKAQKVICLMDVSKLNYSMPYTFAKASDIDIIISDQILPEAYQKLMRKAHVRML